MGTIYLGCKLSEEGKKRGVEDLIGCYEYVLMIVVRWWYSLRESFLRHPDTAGSKGTWGWYVEPTGFGS